MYGKKHLRRKNRSVADTGVPEEALLDAIADTDIFVSPQLLDEYREVPRQLLESGKIDVRQFQSLISGIAAFVSRARVVYPDHPIVICRDQEDNMLLECCKTARADYLITGDRDLLELEKLPFRLMIVTPRRFLERKKLKFGR